MRATGRSTFRSSSYIPNEGGTEAAALEARPLLAALLVSLGALALRLPYLQTLPGGWDAIDFALALDRYDLTAMQPHFPGYPIFVWLGVLAHHWIADPFRALSLVSAISGAASAGAVTLLGAALGGRPAGLLAGVWLAVSPLHWLVSEQPMSDSLGLLGALLFVLAALDFHRRGTTGRAAVAGLALGLTLGVRLSYFPLGVSLLLLLLFRRRWQNLWAAAAGGLSGILPWLLWQMSHEGPGRFMTLALRFTGGHLGDWGGAAGAAHAAQGRLGLFLWRNWAGLGLGGPAAHGDSGPAYAGWLMMAAVAAGLWLGWRRVDQRFLWAWLVPYLAWAYWGQNPENARHLLPIVPVVMIGAAAGWAVHLRRWLAPLACLTVAALVSSASAPLILEQAVTVPPVVQLARHLAEAPRAPVFTWEEERAIRYFTPDVTVHRLRRLTHFEQVLLSAPELPQQVLATSAFLHGLSEAGADVRPAFRPLVRFRGNPLIFNTYHDITLYLAGPELYEPLARAVDRTSAPR